VAAAAAVAVIVSLLTVSGSAMHNGHTAPAASAALPTVPDRFSSVTPYARFGWLPASFSAPDQTSQTVWQLEVGTSAASGGGVDLMVYPAQACTITGQVVLRPQTYPHGLSCKGNLGPTALTGPAPDINGGRAYWTKVRGLVWEYGRSAWAWLTL